MPAEIIISIFGLIAGIIMFGLGRTFERRKIANENRLKLVEPIEAWVDKVSRLNGIISETVAAANNNYAKPIAYNLQEVIDTAKLFAETKSKVFGILESPALSTAETKSIAIMLKTKLLELTTLVENEFIPTHQAFNNKVDLRLNVSNETYELIQIGTRVEGAISEIYGIIATLKTKLN